MMTTPKDGWDRDEREVVDRLARELDELGARHASDPTVELLRAAQSELLPEEAQEAARRHLAESAWSRAVIEGLDEAVPAFDDDDGRRLLARIHRRAKESQAADHRSLWSRLRVPAYVLGAVAVVATVGWLSRQPTAPPTAPASASRVETPSTPEAPAASYVLALTQPPIRLSMAALTWRGAQAENPLLADLKPGLDAFRGADYPAANTELSRIAAKYPDAIEVHYYLGVSRLFMNDTTPAIDSLRVAERVADASFAPDVAWYLAVAFERDGRRDETRRVLTTLCAGGTARAAAACGALKHFQEP